LSYLRLVINPHDEEALKRIINVPARGIGDTTLNKILECARLHEATAWTVLSDPLNYNLNVNAGTAARLSGFRNTISPFMDMIGQQNAYDLAHAVVKASGIVAEAKQENTPESLSRVENIEELLKAIHEYCQLRYEEDGTTVLLNEYLSEVSLYTDQDEKSEDENQRVTLMTVHASKGLEFKHVFVVGMEEELFPSSRSLNSERELEEERRLFYVAITRAKVTCHISYAKSRFRNGKSNFCNPSRFIKDINPEYLNLPKDNRMLPASDFASERRFYTEKMSAVQPIQKTITKPKNLKKIEPVSTQSVSHISVEGLSVGTQVEHAIFGKGIVSELSGTGNDLRAVVDFEQVGSKNLLLKYAKLQITK
jgi:DNA helicase-2/ATP-dependent DNA helicase PcrA